MANTNIPTSLTTSTQIPVDGKTYKNTLSDISNVTSEKAYTYYAGMIVTLASDNKQYQWKQVEVGKTPVSNTFTYPANHSVEGYDYSNKSFAFYEYKNDSGSVTPQPDNRTIYRTEMKNLPTPMVTDYRVMFGNIYSNKIVDDLPNADNYKNENFNLFTLGSRTLNIIRGSNNSRPNDGNILWIDYLPERRGEVSLVTPSELITVDLNNTDTIVIRPEDRSPIIEIPDLSINRPIDFVIPWDGEFIVRAPIQNNPIFNNANANSRIKIGNNTKLIFESPLALNSNVEIIGNGNVVAKSQTLPFISGKSEFKLQDINLSLENIILADISENSKGSLINSKVSISNEHKSLISAIDSDVSILNTELKVNNLSVEPIINASGLSNIDLVDTTINGNADKIFTISQGEVNNAPKISINNSNLDGLVATSLFTGIDNNENIIVENLKVNNTLISNTDILENSVSGFKNTNIIVKGENTSISKQQSLQLFNSRKEAALVLGEYQLFINTLYNNDDVNKWVVDFSKL